MTDGTAAVDALVTEAESAQAAAEAAQAAAETAQSGAETAQSGAETAQSAAETAQTGAETAETNAASSASSVQSALANINQANAPAALRSALAQGAEIVNEWPDAGIITKSASVEQASDGTWTMPDDTYLWLDIPTAPVEAYNLSFGFDVLAGDGRYLTAVAEADGAVSEVVAVPVEAGTDGTPPLTYLAEGSELDFGGTNLVVKITNPAGNGEVKHHEPRAPVRAPHHRAVQPRRPPGADPPGQGRGDDADAL